MAVDDLDGTNNQRRILHEVVSLKLWFDPVEGEISRNAFHATVAFQEARIGEDQETSEVRFNLSVKRCDIVFIPPSDPKIVVDPRSVMIPSQLSPIAERKRQAASQKLGFGTKLKVVGSAIVPSIGLDAAASRERESSLVSEQAVSPYDETWKETHEGYDAWSVDGGLLDKGRLKGTIWSGREGARLHLVDKRDQEVADRERARQMEPEARVEIRCRAEDLDIYSIEFKDPARQEKFGGSKYSNARLLAAREFIRTELSGRLLEPGDIGKSNLAKVKIADVTVKIY